MFRFLPGYTDAATSPVEPIREFVTVEDPRQAGGNDLVKRLVVTVSAVLSSVDIFVEIVE